jgi:putative transposase
MKTNRFRLDPTAEQAAILHHLGDRVSALWNAANYTCRQAFLAGDHVPSYATLCRAFRDHEAFRALPSDIAQEVLKKLREAWTSYFALRRLWKAGDLPDKPGLPRYRKDRKSGIRWTGLIPLKCGRAYRVQGRTVTMVVPQTLHCGRLVVAYRGTVRYVGRFGRGEVWYDRLRSRWYMASAVHLPDNASTSWPGVAGIDLGIRILASLSIAGVSQAFHFAGRDVLKDWLYWTRQIARHQQELAVRGKKTSRRLKRLYAKRRTRLAHAWDAMARRMAALCHRFRVGRVVIGWPKDILKGHALSRKWNGVTHGFWSFDQMSQRLIGALSRVGIISQRTAERGTSSQCPQCDSRRVRRHPRAVLHCRACKLSIHSDQAGSRNMVRQKYPVYWDGAEAALTPDTRRFNKHRWVDAYNPATRVADPAA